MRHYHKSSLLIGTLLATLSALETVFATSFLDPSQSALRGAYNDPLSFQPDLCSMDTARATVEAAKLQLDQIVLLGDSITEYSFDATKKGWGAALQHAYSRRLDVVLRGYSGYNTEWAKHLVRPILSTTRPRLITIFFGANDAAIPSTHLQHVPLTSYISNLQSIVSTIRSHDPAIRVLLITPPPLHEGDWNKRCAATDGRDLDRNVKVTRSYADACKEVGRTEGVPVLDLWEAAFGLGGSYDGDHAQSLLADGLHFNSKGNTLLADSLLKKIAQEWPDMDQAKMKVSVPWYREIDQGNLPASLFMT
ncbi:hypothetical protein HKX48_006609 [Thoreauomyces humboldtii]|nr:hypothetical protein HKX48_006609 [Thoreauomyces humboldtii]